MPTVSSCIFVELYNNCDKKRERIEDRNGLLRKTRQRRKDSATAGRRKGINTNKDQVRNNTFAGIAVLILAWIGVIPYRR
jgi:hypothetical protein